MAKRLRLFFVALLIVAFAIFGYLNIWQFFTSRSVGTPMISYNSSVVSVLVLQNSESRNVVENSYELSVKKTRERMWELIVERLRTINDTSRQWHKHHATDHSLSTPNAFASGFESSLSSSKAVTPRPNSVQFHHASDAVRSWNSGSNHAVVLADLPSINVSSVNCTALIHGDKKELRYARRFQATHTKEKVMAMKFVQQASNCTQFVAERHYVTSPVNREEAEFRIAFSILMFKDVEQFERLLRAIYRPQNFYCIHVDNKSSSEIHTAVNMIAHCFENVFVLQRSFDVRWGTFSVLEPELACMKRLLRRSKKWKYFINLTGQEFPLKTNWQIVRILKAFNGSNNMEGTIKRRNLDRFAGKLPAPHNINITKGSVHIVVVRAFVEYAIQNRTAVEFLDWVKNTYIPDETFFTSLNHNPRLKVPGSYLGETETHNTKYPFITRFKNWGDGPFDWPCNGKRVSMVCIFGVGDLPLLASRPELFANKFYIDYEPLAFDCIEQLHYQRLRDEVLDGDAAQFNTSFYAAQEFVWNHV